MSHATTASALRTRLESLVLSPVLPIVWENDEFKPESDGGEAGWLYAEIYLSGEEAASIGTPDANIHRDRGLFVVNIVVPRGEKIGRTEAIGDLIRAHFKSESVTGIHFTNRWIGRGRLSESNSRWYATPVLMEFWTDRLEAAA